MKKDKVVEGIKDIIRIYPKERMKWSWDCEGCIEGLAQAIKGSLVINEDYLKDIIYSFTQHLELPDKDVALLNRGLSDALLRANLIQVKK